MPCPSHCCKGKPFVNLCPPSHLHQDQGKFHLINHRFWFLELGILNFDVHVEIERGWKLTWFLTYHGYHGTFVVNFSCEIEYLVAVTGTTESTSPLQIVSKKMAHQVFDKMPQGNGTC